MTIDRRNFLKLAGTTAGVAAATSSGVAHARPNKKMPEEAVGLLFDGTLCIGCRACMPACKESNDMPPELTPLKVNGEEVNALWDAPLDISGSTLNIIKAYRNGTAEHKDQAVDGFAFTKQSCFHCADPSCVSACPVSAMIKDPVNGIVSYSVEACIGCRYCVAACPFGVPRFTYDTPKPKISKCELCRHRHADGKYSACAEVCPTGATLYGKVKDLKAEIARRKALPPGTTTTFPRGRIGGNDTYVGQVGKYVERVYGEHEIGGTQVLHLSGVPFDLLDKPPLPDQAPAATSETIQHGVYYGLLAPATFLGILVAAARRNMRAAEEPKKPEGGAP
ncbi:MAG: hydrogenase 2 operon protein HybA [Myxococcales bacterium]|nr:hydrogenase 2 operon protein HybA [Myxococcales bacterium]MDP3501095.1 hydrogenase 2 operon protein HybA [Myxococcales bacterium]